MPYKLWNVHKYYILTKTGAFVTEHNVKFKNYEQQDLNNEKRGKNLTITHTRMGRMPPVSSILVL